MVIFKFVDPEDLDVRARRHPNTDANSRESDRVAIEGEETKVVESMPRKIS